MANNVQNIVIFQNGLDNILEKLKKNRLKDDGYLFSLGWVIPEPQMKKDCPAEFIATEKSHIVRDKDLPWFNWYDWRCHFWGTKWDCYEVEVVPDELRFYTAWVAPIPVYEALAKMFPDEPFTVKFADEDLGYNCGTIEYDGNGSELFLTSCSQNDISEEDAMEFACDVWGLDYDEEMEYRKGDN